jgi:serine/threonine-protein kinase HipA
MTSEPTQAFVWTWLAGASDPVVAGRLDTAGPIVTFTYGRSYLEREDRIALYLPELPLMRGPIPPRVGDVAGCIADAAPDAWGQRVILNSRLGRDALDTADLGLLTYLLDSGSDRIGALDFQTSASEYIPRTAGRSQSSPSPPSGSSMASLSPPRSITRCSAAARSAAPGQRRCCATASAA